MGYRVAVVGATGNVGRELFNILAERQFPLDDIAAVASSRSTGDLIDFGDSGEELRVKNLEHFDFSGWDIALFAAGAEVSKIYAPKAAAAGFQEPSLVFMTGTSTVLTDGSGAADFLSQGTCRFALVEARTERNFAQRAEAIGLRYNVYSRIEGFNISQGRAVTISIFRSEGTE